MKNRFDDFLPNEAQEKAFKKVVSAMKAAKKLGLCFLGKQDVLVAYTDKAQKYARDNGGTDRLCSLGTELIPHLHGWNVLDDSGADDYEQFLKKDYQAWKDYIELIEN